MNIQDAKDVVLTVAEQEKNNTTQQPEVSKRASNSLSSVTEADVQRYVEEKIIKFKESGEQPIIWKKSYYLLFSPAFLVISLVLFLYKFEPSLMYSSILIICVAIYVYFKYDEFATQEIAITPFSLIFTHKRGLFQVETIEMLFGTEDIKYMKVEPYSLEHLYGFMRIFAFLKPNKWFSSSNVYIYNSDLRPVTIPYVYQCELFQNYLVQKIQDALSDLDSNYQSKTGVVINNHLYEDIDGKLTRVSDL